jgi:predicted SprT family Zn-dependent metalloprotease
MDKQHLPALLQLGVDAGIICWNKLSGMYPKLRGPFPQFRLNNRLKSTAGRMWCGERICELSPELFFYNQEEFVKVIIPHELIHLVDYDLTGNQGHGPTWKQIMVSYGLPPDRLHDLVNPVQVKRNNARK